MQQEFLSALKCRDKATVEKRGDTKQTTGALQAGNSSFCSYAKTKTVKGSIFFVFVCISKEKNPRRFSDGRKKEKEVA
jgi:hypothetical protein